MKLQVAFLSISKYQVETGVFIVVCFYFFFQKEHLKLQNLNLELNKEQCPQRRRDFENLCTVYNLSFSRICIGFLLSLCSFWFILLCFSQCQPCYTHAPSASSFCRVAVVLPWMAGKRFQLALCKSSADCLLCRELDCGCQVLS